MTSGSVNITPQSGSHTNTVPCLLLSPLKSKYLRQSFVIAHHSHAQPQMESQIPVELWNEICRNISVADKKSLLLCSKKHAAFVRPSLYENIRVNDSYPRKPVIKGRNRIHALAATVATSEFGPLIWSIHIIENGTSRVRWKELLPFFRSMTSLRKLTVWRPPTSPFESIHFSEVFSGVASSLVEFSSSDTPLSAAVIEFLSAHKRLVSWNIGTIGLRTSPTEAEEFVSVSRSPSAAAGLAQLRACTVNPWHSGLTVIADMLQSTPNLTQLSINYRYTAKHQKVPLDYSADTATINVHLDSFAMFSANLTHLTVCETPHLCHQPFSWVISNLLPHTPELRHLELRQCLFDSTHIIHQQVIDMSSFMTVAPKLPRALQTVKWIGGNSFSESQYSGLSTIGKRNVEALLQLFPLLEVVEYHERSYMFVFTRGKKGSVKRKTYRNRMGEMLSNGCHCETGECNCLLYGRGLPSTIVHRNQACA